ncbi:MAG: M10 family metallopeptidase C-terminal domain-containing protein [Caulobacteraceae bacterium]
MFSAARMRAFSPFEERIGFEVDDGFNLPVDFGRGFERSLGAAWCGVRETAKNPSVGNSADTKTFAAAAPPTPLHFTPAQSDGPSMLLCGCPSCMKANKAWDAFPADGVGGDKDPGPTAPILLTVDAQPGDTTTLSPLIVDGPHVISTLDMIGDFDFFRVQLVEGQLYNIGQYLVTGGPSGVPLADAYIELYDSAGNLITSADGGGPNTPSGLDALLTFEATYTGTYFINARAYDNGTPGGLEGDFVGDYEIFVDSVDPNDPGAYRPLYSPDQPMHSIDWGSQIDRTSRNPDGDNGPRDNGAPNTGVVYNPTFDITGANVVTYYFARTGDIFIDENPATPGSTDTMVAEGWQPWERNAMLQALQQYSNVCDIVYVEVQSREEADFVFITYEGTPGVGASLLGRMSPPNEENEGRAEFNAGDARWTEAGLQQGGFYFPTLLHELGHGHGMAHPHDNGGRSSIMRGTDDGSVIGGGLGDYNLNQQVFTVMSYNDGWQTSPYGQPRSGGITGTEVDHYGWVGTLTAFDIAVMQDKYGVNEEWAIGNDVYTLSDVNGPGTYYSCIWDAGGSDTIRYDGARDAYIDLRAATLEYEEGGGGWVSYAYGIHGGFTIANGAAIENAASGAGNDMLVGNDVANVLSGRAGNDIIQGGGAADHVNGEGGDDTLIGGAGADTVIGGAGYDTASYEDATAGVVADLSNPLGTTGDAAGDTFSGVEGLRGSGFADTLRGNVIANTIRGGAGADVIDGRGGADTLNGGAGVDTLTGGLDNDSFVFHSGQANGDTVLDFSGAGALAGDMLVFEGYGTAADGASFTRIDATRWMITSADGLTTDIITLLNGASVDASDYMFAG